MSADITHVWIVNRLDEVDPLYVFVDEDQAREYAARFGEDVGAIITEEVVMNSSAGGQFLIDTHEADDNEEQLSVAPPSEPDDLDVDHPIIYRVKTEDRDGMPHDDYDAFESATEAFAQYAATALGGDPDVGSVYVTYDDGGTEHVIAAREVRQGDDTGQVTDGLALDQIAHMLRDPEWAPGMLEDIAALVVATGRSTDNLPDDAPTWDRH